MKFIVTRTSSLSYAKKPCDDSRLVFESYDFIDRRTVTEEIFNERRSKIEGLWRSKGIKHTTCNDGKWIQRVLPNGGKGWFIELNSLEELIEFKAQVESDIIIGTDIFNNGIYEIEIYDDWRE